MFKIPKNFHIDDFLKNRWSIMDEGENITFVVKFNQTVARYVDEQHYYTNTSLKKNDDGSILFTTTVKSPKEFLTWVRCFGLDAEVLEPTEFREQLREEYREMAEKYASR